MFLCVICKDIMYKLCDLREPMLSAMIFNSLHHDVVSIERYVDQSRSSRLFVCGVAKRQLRVVN